MDRFHLADCADHACSICIHKIFCNTIILHVLQNAPCCNSLFQVTQRLLLLQYWLKLNHPLMKTNGVSFLWYVVFMWCTFTLKCSCTGSINFSLKRICFCIFRFTKTRYQIIAGFLTVVLTVAAEAHHSIQKVTFLRIFFSSPMLHEWRLPFPAIDGSMRWGFQKMRWGFQNVRPVFQVCDMRNLLSDVNKCECISCFCCCLWIHLEARLSLVSNACQQLLDLGDGLSGVETLGNQIDWGHILRRYNEVPNLGLGPKWD